MNEAVVATYLAGGNTRRIRGALQPLLKAPPLSKSAVSRVVATLKDEISTSPFVPRAQNRLPCGCTRTTSRPFSLLPRNMALDTPPWRDQSSKGGWRVHEADAGEDIIGKPSGRRKRAFRDIPNLSFVKTSADPLGCASEIIHGHDAEPGWR